MLPGWLNENSYRDYPLQTGATLWQDAIADMGILLGPRPDAAPSVFSNYDGLSDFVPALDNVALASVHDTGTHTVFTFVLGASFAAASLIFNCTNADPPFSTYFSQASVNGVVFWEGFLTTGYLVNTRAGLATLPGNTFTGDSTTLLEPSLIRNLSARHVTSVSLANFPRVTVTDAPGCSSLAGTHGYQTLIDFPHSRGSLNDLEVLVSALDLRGNIKFRAGSNCDIRQEAGSNSIVISGALGAGTGLACKEIPLTSLEHSHAGEHPLTGGPSCQDVLQTLNGVSGTNIRISAGQGFHVQTDDFDPHTLMISAKATDFAVCLQ